MANKTNCNQSKMWMLIVIILQRQTRCLHIYETAYLLTGNPFISFPVPHDCHKSLIYIQQSCILQFLKGGVLGSLRLLGVKSTATNKNILPTEPKPAVYFLGCIHSEVLVFSSATPLQNRKDEAFSSLQLPNTSFPFVPPQTLSCPSGSQALRYGGQFPCSTLSFSQRPKPNFTWTHVWGCSALLCLWTALPILWINQVKVTIKDQPLLRLGCF